MELPDSMARDVGKHLRAVEVALGRATAALQHPGGHRAEWFEDRLNEIQDEAYKARSAYNPAATQPKED